MFVKYIQILGTMLVFFFFFWSIYHHLESSGMRYAQLRNYLHQVDVYASLWVLWGPIWWFLTAQP